MSPRDQLDDIHYHRKSEFLVDTFQHTSVDSPPQAGTRRVLVETLRVAEFGALISSLDLRGYARELWRAVLLRYCLGMADDRAMARCLAGNPAPRHRYACDWSLVDTDGRSHRAVL